MEKLKKSQQKGLTSILPIKRKYGYRARIADEINQAKLSKDTPEHALKKALIDFYENRLSKVSGR